MKLKVEISTGELIDKITILEIKIGRISDPLKIMNVIRELKALSPVLNKLLSENRKNMKKLLRLKKLLHNVNSKLWIIENKIRKFEEDRTFNKNFIDAARNVYVYNDKRSEIKSRINSLTNSKIREVKDYERYK